MVAYVGSFTSMSPGSTEYASGDAQLAKHSRTLPSPRRRRRFGVGAASLLMLGILQAQRASAVDFVSGDAIEVKIIPDDSIDITLSGTEFAAFAFSIQQCSGNSRLYMSVEYNGTQYVSPAEVTTNRCHRVLAGDSDADSSDYTYERLCAFSRSSAIDQGYLKTTSIVDSTSTVDALDAIITLNNTGTTDISAQMVMYTTDDFAPDVDSSIDRALTYPEQDENLYTVELDFQAADDDDDTYCSSETGCAVYAYYVEVDADDDEEDLNFATTCQAYGGTLGFETTITADDSAAAAFTTSICVQFPQEVEATYRVYLVISPDTFSYSRVGFGLQDQLIFASGDLNVGDDAALSCPEDEDEDDDSTSDAVRRIVPVKAAGALAVSLAAAAASRGL